MTTGKKSQKRQLLNANVADPRGGVRNSKS